MKYLVILVAICAFTALGIFAGKQIFEEQATTDVDLNIVNSAPMKQKKFILMSIDHGNHFILEKAKKFLGINLRAVYIATWKSHTDYGVEILPGWKWIFSGVGQSLSVNKGIITTTAPELKILGTSLHTGTFKESFLNKSIGVSEEEMLSEVSNLRNKLEECNSRGGLLDNKAIETARISIEEILSELFVAANPNLPNIRVRVTFENETELQQNIQNSANSADGSNCKSWING